MRLWRREKQPAQKRGPWPVGAPDKRVYAIGDVHGCLDMLEDLLGRISEDESGAPERAETYIVFVGDLIDRGPDSAGVIERLMTTDWSYVKPVFLMGNHEEMFLRIMGGASDMVIDWLSYGGYELANSYGVDVGSMLSLKPAEIVQRLRDSVPQAHLDFIGSFADSFRFGDYLFVHAGIRPKVAIEQQATNDLRWIREGFLDVVRNDGLMVVHGHTIVTADEQAPDRIGIDTGAYAGGPLSAIRVDGADRRFIRVNATAAVQPSAR